MCNQVCSFNVIFEEVSLTMCNDTINTVGLPGAHCESSGVVRKVEENAPPEQRAPLRLHIEIIISKTLTTRTI